MKILLFSILTFSLAHLLSCSTGDLETSNSAEAAFKAAEEYDKDERYEEALQKYAEVKNRHPYSRYAIESELKIADIHFKRESFIEAQTAYQLFKDFHPKYAKIDYVTFRLALSYFDQLPSTIDRDLSPAFKAIEFFDEVLNSYSASEYAKEAKEKRTEAYKMLAEKEAYIANFYYIRDVYDSALRRYEGLLKKFPNSGQDELAMYRAGVSAFETGDKAKGKKHISELLSTHPKGEFVEDAKRALEKYGSR